MRGDDAPGAMADRPEWRAVALGPPEDMFERFAALSAKLMTRTAGLIALGEAAADVDPELAEQRDRVHQANRHECETLAAALKFRGALAPTIDVQDAADIVYAVAGNENIFLRLTRECGWTEARYADLIANTLKFHLGPKAGRPRKAGRPPPPRRTAAASSRSKRLPACRVSASYECGIALAQTALTTTRTGR